MSAIAPPTSSEVPPAQLAHSITEAFDSILILDFGSQYSHLITRRCREFNVYCEMLPCTQKMKDLKWKPKGIILSGSPYSVYDKDAPRVDPDVFTYGVPVLGICYGLQEIGNYHGAKVEASDHREYGEAIIKILKQPEGSAPHMDKLFEGIESNSVVWMSHSDRLHSLPDKFSIIATTESAPFCALAHQEKPIYGIQFHPEVTHSKYGKQVLERFIVGICQCKREWTMENFIDKEIQRIRDLVGPKGQVIGAVSGGVDSSVAAKLMHEAIGDRQVNFV
ncbi:GMP synthase (glutamine-hydrolyzing) [Microbotryomycetes sp. JL221]|nr:GMP synthase (glutamine-hydrolyzing) [Microbotryomycetes sp. JL221]